MDPVKQKLESEEEQEFLEITTVLKKTLRKVRICVEASVVCNTWEAMSIVLKAHISLKI